MKTISKMISRNGLMALGVMVGVAGFAGTASADDRHDDRRGPEKVVLVQKETVRVVQPGHMMRQPVRGGLFDRLDINNDGRVSQWEFQQRYGNSRTAMWAFNQADRNDSGKLSQREVAQARGMLRGLPMRG